MDRESHLGNQAARCQESSPFFLADGRPWFEGNLWVSRQAARILNGELKLKTIQTSALAIHAYMQFLEAEGIDWWHFPPEREERCLIRYSQAAGGK
jgi:hypothetical protein